MNEDERRRHHDRIVNYVLYGADPPTIGLYISNHPDLSQLNRQLDEFYILPR